MVISKVITNYLTTRLAAPQAHRPWATSPLAVIWNKAFSPTRVVQHSLRGRYEVAFLSQEEMQKLADHNFTKFLEDFKPKTPDKQ